MQLIQPQKSHLLEMMSWFSNEKELSDWSGPNFRFPYDFSSFVEDLKIDSLNSFALMSDDSEFLAFGQYYLRLNKCHLGRLIVNPRNRGRGIASELINKLSELGLKDLGVKECSLFVLSNNLSAIKSYEKSGFKVVEYPAKIELENCLYMVK